MLATVDLDDKPVLQADEIDDIRTQRRLASELAASEPAAKLVPQAPFHVLWMVA